MQRRLGLWAEIEESTGRAEAATRRGGREQPRLDGLDGRRARAPSAQWRGVDAINEPAPKSRGALLLLWPLSLD